MKYLRLILKLFNIPCQRNQQGSAIIGFILLAAVGTAYYITNVTGLIKDISKEKSKSEYDYYTTSLSHGLFNYTLNAIKERWCMNKNWGRNISCNGPEMKDIVLNKMNLERFLWSKATVIDIEQRYKAKYGVPIPESASLILLEHTVTLENLETLGLSHPLNLLLDNTKLKNCLESVTIKIEKPQASQFIPLGDETSLMITITKNLKTNMLGNCSFLNHNRILKGLALFFPRTLNQFALIKAGDLDLTNYIGEKTQPGIVFHGPVYLENNLIIPNSNYAAVTFKETIRFGGGSLKYKNNDLYSPLSAGLHKDMLQSHYSNFGGLFGGLGLEGEIDEGISALYGETYTYPENSLIANCTNRKNLKDNPSLTRDSRLMIKSNGTNTFQLGLTLDNEFRESSKFGAVDDYYIRDTAQNENNLHDKIKQKLTINYTQRNTLEKPVVAITSHLAHNDEPSNFPGMMNSDVQFFHKTLMGRDSSVNLQLSNTRFLEEQAATLEPRPNGVIDLSNFKPEQLGDDAKITDIKATYNDLQSVCDNLKNESWWLPECKITHEKHGINSKYDCKDTLVLKSSAPDLIPEPQIPVDFNDINNSLYNDYYQHSSRNQYKLCMNLQNDALAKYLAYISAEDLFKTELNSFKDAPPTIQIKTTDILSNKLGFELNILNEANFDSIFANNVQKVYLRLTAFDFLIEEANDLDRGKRYRSSHLPGPNHVDSDNKNEPNTIYFDTASKQFKYLDNDKNLSERIENNKTSLNPQGWSVLKREQGGTYPEPPLNTVDGNEVPIIPRDGLSTLKAKENDELCSQDVNPLDFTEWDVSFTPTTQFSWLYNVTAPGITITDPSLVTKRPSYIFPKETDTEMTPGSRLPSYSIVQDCIINSNINFVLGFFACDNLIIRPRTSKLDIVGTFVVKNLDIDSSVLGAGVNFYSLWHNQAVQILQQKGWLERESNSATSKACSSITIPGWARNLNADMTLDFISCSPMKFIYSGANNFNWTTIDPEIGMDPNGTDTTTKSKVINRYRRYTTSVVWRQEYDLL